MNFHKVDVSGRDILDAILPSEIPFALRKDINDSSAGKISAQGFDASGKKIENIGAPENPNDAVNLAYLNSSGAADKFYKHVQSEASTRWRIPHMFGRTPNISVKNISGDDIIGVRADESDDIAVVVFTHANMGFAYCS